MRRAMATGLFGLVVVGFGVTAASAAARVAVGSDDRVTTASQPPKYVIESLGFSVPQGAFDTTGTVSCPTGTATWGGGVEFNSFERDASINTTEWDESTPGGWITRLNNPDPLTDTASVYAVCAKQPSGYEWVSHETDDPAGTQAFGVVSCPADKVILSGSVLSTGDTSNIYLIAARPVSAREFRAGQWNGSSTDRPFFVDALCAAKPPGYARTSGSATATPGAESATFAACPSATKVIGGGFGYSAAGPSVLTNASIPASNSQGSFWDVIAENLSATTETVTAYAICAR